MAKAGERMRVALLEVRNISKVYKTRSAGPGVKALRDVSCSVNQGEFVAIMGESGSGKTTLLNILAVLDKPTSGQVLLQGQDLTRVRDRNLATFRREHLGFVFQDFNLLDELTVRDNIFLPLVLAGTPHAEMEHRMMPLVKSLGIAQLLDQFPYELSGGQKQRVAVARALITRPAILLADEPTGALDSHASQSLLSIFQQLNARGQTILMVTHSVQAASHAERVLFLKDGRFRRQLRRGNHSREELYKAISRTLEKMTAHDQGDARG
jgi:putative ABC transport system ATP-binding protein